MGFIKSAMEDIRRALSLSPRLSPLGPILRTRGKRGGVLHFTCNICERLCRCRTADLGRETPTCPGCGSTVRMRAMVSTLSKELFGSSLTLADFPSRPDLRGMGLSDWDRYAIPLAAKLGYINTFYHQEPRLDIDAIDPALESSLDFLIASDVFEHVPPPISIAFENARRLLRPGGVFVFSVPYSKEGETREHFPELHRWEIVVRGGRKVLINITKDGSEQIFSDLIFHGGDGSTLEMRVFSESSLLQDFERAGFQDIRIWHEPEHRHGICWQEDWSLPLSARTPRDF